MRSPQLWNRRVSGIEKSTVEARQGRGGRRVLVILVVSLALIAIAYFAIYFFVPRPPRQAVVGFPRPILAAATPVLTPTVPPAMISLSQ